jgi:prepilin-type N-terminal cleavage/methylation domain-containing protein
VGDAPARGRVRADPEAGFSLVEILVTIVIVGMAFTAILGGMITSITVSDLHRNQATADTLARNAAESVKDSNVPYVPCAGPNAYAPALPSGTSITKVEYWNGAAPTPATSYAVTFSPSCPPQDQGLQRITITASSGGATETVQVLKRNIP